MNKTYCPMPFMHIYNGSDGRYEICCHHSGRSEIGKQNITVNDTLPFDHFLSPTMDNLRKKMLNGEKITACKNCYASENLGGWSKRTEYIKKEGYVTELNKVIIKLRIFGNYCNLSCYMCHPFNSSTRTNELIELNEDGPNTSEKLSNSNGWRFEDNMKFTKVSYEQVENNILKNIHRIKAIQITGGEPLQSLRMYKFLEKIPNEYNHIPIGFTSNLTKVQWKNKSLDDILEKFTNVGIKVSCDHYLDKLKWIRYPIDVDEFEDNVFQYRKYCKISPTISVLNVNELDDINKYYQENFKIRVFYDTASIVNSPFSLTPVNHYNYLNLQKKYKTSEAFSHLYTFLTGDKWLKNRDENRKNMFIYLDKLSKKRGDYKKLWNKI